MHPARKQRLQTTLFIVLVSSIAIGLILYALGQNLNAFYSPTQVQAGEVSPGSSLRAGGCVVPGSIIQAEDSLQTSFVIADHDGRVEVRYDGILPDLFGEGEAAVATGILQDGNIILASEVLAKHDESYMPPEVTASLKKEAEAAGQEFSLTCQDLNL